MPETYLRPDLTDYLNQLKDRCPQIINAVLLAADGHVLTASEGYARDDAETTAASFSALAGIMKDQAVFCDKDQREDFPWEGCLSGIGGHTVVVLPAGKNTRIAISVKDRMTSPASAAAVAETAKSANSLKDLFATESRTTSGQAPE